MFVRSLTACVCLVIGTSNGNAAELAQDREHLDKIVDCLEELIEKDTLERRAITIEIKDGVVTVIGRVESAQEVQLIVESVTSIEDLRGLHLNLGIGQQPTATIPGPRPPAIDLDLRRAPLNWDDGYWELDFDPQPIRHRFNSTQAR